MNTSTSIAVTLAVIVALAFIFFGSSIRTSLLGNTASAPTTARTTTVNTSTLPSSGNAVPSDKLSITDDVVGTGAVAKAGDTISVQYSGSLADGTVFDSTKAHGGKPFTFTLGAGQVIKGWDEGFAGMKVGGTRTLVIPPALGYGERTVGPIPANSTLTFKVELVKVEAPVAK